MQFLYVLTQWLFAMRIFNHINKGKNQIEIHIFPNQSYFGVRLETSTSPQFFDANTLDLCKALSNAQFFGNSIKMKDTNILWSNGSISERVIPSIN